MGLVRVILCSPAALPAALLRGAGLASLEAAMGQRCLDQGKRGDPGPLFEEEHKCLQGCLRFFIDEVAFGDCRVL